MPEITPARRRLALLAIALGGFGIGCSEFASMGLLPQVAGDLLGETYRADPHAGIAQAGWIISAYALGVVVGAPVLAAWGARRSRTTLLAVMAGALALGTILSASLPSFGWLVVARFFAGLPHGAYFGLASLVAGTIMGPGNQAKGVALAMSGLTVANVIGVPAMTWIGQVVGWRVAYLACAAIFAATAVAVAALVPHQVPIEGASARTELRVFRRPSVWRVGGAAAIGFGGFFAVYSYLAETAVKLTHLAPTTVPWVLALVGVGMTIGNVIGGHGADKDEHRTLHLGFVLLLGALALYGLFAWHPVGLFVTAFLVSITNSVLNTAMQSRLIHAGGDARLLAAALNHSAFNVANSLGALLGGGVIALGFGYLAPAWVGLVLAAIGWVIVTIDLRRAPTLSQDNPHESPEIAAPTPL